MSTKYCILGRPAALMVILPEACHNVIINQVNGSVTETITQATLVTGTSN
jgi:hypothetical protein